MLEHGPVDALGYRHSFARLFLSRLWRVTRIPNLGSVRSQGSRIMDTVGEACVRGSHQIQDTTNVVGLRKLDLMPDEDRLQQLLDGLLGMKRCAEGK